MIGRCNTNHILSRASHKSFYRKPYWRSPSAQQRLDALKGMTLVVTTPDALALAQALITQKIVPPQAAQDALHIAIATTQGIPYLLTWNCKHIANANVQAKAINFCSQLGFQPTLMCTPEQLTGVNP